MIKHIFVAGFEHGYSHLAKVEVKEETKKTFIVDAVGADDLIGCSWTGVRILKSRVGVFDSEHEALLYLIDKGSEYMRAQELETATARSRVKMLEQMIEGSEEPK